MEIKIYSILEPRLLAAIFKGHLDSLIKMGKLIINNFWLNHFQTYSINCYMYYGYVYIQLLHLLHIITL